MSEQRRYLILNQPNYSAKKGVIAEYKNIVVNSQSVLKNTDIKPTTSWHIYQQGLVSNCTVHSGVSIYVSRGIITNTTISSGASVTIFALNSELNNITISSGAKINTTFENVSEYDPFEFTFITGSNTNIASDTLSYLGYNVAGNCSNGTWTGLSGYYRLGIGNIQVINPIVESGGRIYIKDGGVISGGEVLTAGNISLFESGFCYNVSLGPTDGTDYGRLNVFSGGLANQTTIYTSGRCRINESGIANDVVVSAQGQLVVLSGGTMSSTTISSGGRMWISSGGLASNVTLLPKAKLEITSGGATIDTLTLRDSVFTTKMTTIQGNNTIYNLYLSGAIQEKICNTTISGGVATGSQSADTASTRMTTYVCGGTLIDYQLTTYGNNTAANCTWILLQSQSTTGSSYASNIRIDNRAKLQVMGGNLAENIQVVSGGSLRIDSNGSANNVFISGRYSVNNVLSILTISSGGIVTDTEVHSGGTIQISAGGMLTSATLHTGAKLTVSSGGTALLVTSNTGAVIDAQSGATVEIIN